MQCNLRQLTLLPAALFFLFQPAQAQKRNYTIAEATNGIVTTLRPQALSQPAFRPGTQELYYLKSDSAGARYVFVTDDKNDFKIRTTLKSFNQQIFQKDSLKGFGNLNWLNKDQLFFQQRNQIYKGAVTGDSIQWKHYLSLPADAANFTFHENGKVAAFTVKNNLFWVGNQTPVQITFDTDENILNGSSVHRDEFGITGGIFLSPQGKAVAYYHMDQTMVQDYPIIDWSPVPAENNNIKYPMAGRTSHQVKLRVHYPATGKTIELQTGEPLDHYLTCVTWSPDEQFIYIAILNRDQNHMSLHQYDAQTGEKVKTLFEETDEKYVEPQHPLTFLPGSKDQFIWWSERDGYMHLYLYRTDGKLIRQLTKGNYVVNDLLGFDKAKSEVIITSAKEDPRQKHAYAVNWKNGKIRQLTHGAGTHSAAVSEDGKKILDVYTGRGIAKRTLLNRTDGRQSLVLLDSPNPLDSFNRPEIREITLKATDGTPLYGKLILPPNLDSTRRHPVIVYLYNGPHVQLIKDAFPESGNLWYEYMAQRGYVVFSMDGRGSSNRGKQFEQAVHRQLGTVEMDDQLQGVAFLKSLPYVDTARMGVHGWSFGGFMTTSLMLRHPGVFQVGVAGGPVIDWKLYEIMYTERYMDTPEQNPEGYEQANLLTKTGNLKGKLLLIHGALDNVVVWQHTMNFLKRCVDNGTQVDYFVYPNHEHNVRGKDRVHLMQKISDYFDLYLKPEQP